MGHVSPNLDQDSYAFYDNDAGEATSTIIGTANNQQTLNTDTEYQCRILVQEDNGGSKNNFAAAWQYSHNSGTWTTITTSTSVVQAADTAGNITNGGDTTQRIGAGTYITDNNWQTDTGSGGNCDFSGNDEAESVLAFTIVNADVSDGDEILLRIAGCDTYTRNADINVNKPASSRRAVFVSF